VEFRVLGPLVVLDGGRELPLGWAKQRAVLAILLLHANEVVPTERLIDALWDGAAPATARTALQGHVSRLRKVVGRERLRTYGGGYVPDRDAKRLADVHGRGDEYGALLVAHMFVHGATIATSDR
jgi:DNA-binding SARP family transcriptional activator